MPRPGPRPYECVRRAWHSDRHQPIRGSIIQQIFRVLHESHSPATKKNKEWQEKLPVVVLKAEEIMYSKANSEAEYMDIQTLWERVNDAVDTIIRRDESTESGDFLPPCVEAALNLGCVPVRASRSQRHTNPRSYLSPTPDEPVCSSSKITESPTQNQNHPLPPCSSNQSNPLRPVAMNPPCLVPERKNHVIPNGTLTKNIPSNTGSIYPLYYGTQFRRQPERSQFPFQIPKNPNPVIMGTPVFPSSGMRCCETPIFDTNFGKKHEKAYKPEFDLSLRLGSFKDPCLGPAKGPVDEINKEFSFFPMEATNNDPSGSTAKKRKAPFDINL